jgi:hypothetical protein
MAVGPFKVSSIFRGPMPATPGPPIFHRWARTDGRARAPFGQLACRHHNGRRRPNRREPRPTGFRLSLGCHTKQHRYPGTERSIPRLLSAKKEEARMATSNAHLDDQAGSTSSSIIAADQVEGTNVYNYAGKKLGAVDHVMIDKRTGKVCYAIMSFGGFLGIGQSYHPLPWQKLTYDEAKGGFVVDLDKARLEGAPYSKESTFDWTSDWGRRVDDYYRL